MTRRGLIPAALMATGLLILLDGSQALAGADTRVQNSMTKTSKESSSMTVYYLEIVSNDADALLAAYESVHGLSFGPEDPDLGQARVAARPDGSFVGIRRPLAEHEQPITRTYLEVSDIQKAVERAGEAGAIIAYPPTQHGNFGTFAIFILGDVQHGLWQR